jgi:hypothetical protein
MKPVAMFMKVINKAVMIADSGFVNLMLKRWIRLHFFCKRLKKKLIKVEFIKWFIERLERPWRAAER